MVFISKKNLIKYFQKAFNTECMFCSVNIEQAKENIIIIKIVFRAKDKLQQFPNGISVDRCVLTSHMHHATRIDVVYEHEYEVIIFNESKLLKKLLSPVYFLTTFFIFAGILVLWMQWAVS